MAATGHGRRSRRAVAVATTAAAFVLPFALWMIADASVSPQQRAVDAEPPPPPTVTAEIEMRSLRDVTSLRATLVPDRRIGIAAPEVGDSQAVVIELPAAAGSAVAAGDLVAVVADRPVIVLPMPAPLHRNLTPGDEGDDVARLQRALTDVGIQVDDDGRFGPTTQQAVSELYEMVGFEAVRTGPDRNSELRAAEEEVRAAAAELDGLSESRTEDATQGQMDTARARLRAATEARDEARARIGVTVPRGELSGVATLPATVVEVNASVGDVVDGDVLSLATEKRWFEAPVEGSLALTLQPGAVGEVEGIEPEAELEQLITDDEGRQVARFAVPRGAEEMALGSRVMIEVHLDDEIDPVLALPLSAVRTDPAGEYVILADGSGSGARSDVEIGRVVGGWAEVRGSDDNLQPGTVVRIR